MINILHLSAIILGSIAYALSDVNSSSGFFNTFLPFVVLVSFIYGLIVTINLIYRSRNKSNSTDKSTDFLLASLKEQGLLKKSVAAQATLKSKEELSPDKGSLNKQDSDEL